MESSVGACVPSLLVDSCAWMRAHASLPGTPSVFAYAPRSNAPTCEFGDARAEVKAGVMSATWATPPVPLPQFGAKAAEKAIEESDGVTRVRLTHSELVGEADRANSLGWPDLLAAMQAYVEQAVAEGSTTT